MKKEIRKQMETELERLLEELTKVDPCSEDYRDITARIRDINSTIEMSGVDKKNVIFQGLEVGVKVAGVVLPLMFYSVWMKRGLEFEKEGTFTSGTFKGLTKYFSPKN